MTRAQTENLPSQDIYNLISRLGVDIWQHLRIAPELTTHGLVAVMTDEYLGNTAVAHVVVIGDGTLEVATHTPLSMNDDAEFVNDLSPFNIYNRFEFGDEPFEALDHVLGNRLNVDGSAKDRDLFEAEKRAVKALAIVAQSGCIYDAIHYKATHRYPDLEHGGLRPFAGMQYGARVNLKHMIATGVQVHPAVLEALEK